MTTDRQKSQLGVAALYVFTNQKYWPRVHGSRQRAFVADPLYNLPHPEFTPDPLYSNRQRHEFTVDPRFVG